MPERDFPTTGRVDDERGVTAWSTLASASGLRLLILRPLTGKKHQLRRHCAEVLRAPIVGDCRFGSSLYVGSPQIALHNAHMRFTVGLQTYDVHDVPQGDLWADAWISRAVASASA